MRGCVECTVCASPVSSSVKNKGGVVGGGEEFVGRFRDKR